MGIWKRNCSLLCTGNWYQMGWIALRFKDLLLKITVTGHIYNGYRCPHHCKYKAINSLTFATFVIRPTSRGNNWCSEWNSTYCDPLQGGQRVQTSCHNETRRYYYWQWIISITRYPVLYMSLLNKEGVIYYKSTLLAVGLRMCRTCANQQQAVCLCNILVLFPFRISCQTSLETKHSLLVIYKTQRLLIVPFVTYLCILTNFVFHLYRQLQNTLQPEHPNFDTPVQKYNNKAILHNMTDWQTYDNLGRALRQPYYEQITATHTVRWLPW